jgi:outer membrane protein OmpA-like peptidoglycan-associated protein
MRLIITIILAVLWLLFGIYIFKPCFVINCASDTTQSAAATQSKTDASSNIAPSIAKVTGPILFSWNKEGAVIGDGWDARRKVIIDGLGADKILEITGRYRAEEVNSSTYENLGLARAHDVAKLFKPPLAEGRVTTRGQLEKTGDFDKTSNFKSVAFRNLINTEAIKEIDDKTRISFPFNSVNRIENAEIEAYLDDVAVRVKKSGERIQLTGHTDNVDSEAFNQRLGLKRANMVKQYLLGKGVNASKIIVLSKGETKPIATNNTSAGRAENRRTELQIIK